MFMPFPIEINADDLTHATCWCHLSVCVADLRGDRAGASDAQAGDDAGGGRRHRGRRRHPAGHAGRDVRQHGEDGEGERDTPPHVTGGGGEIMSQDQ